MAVEKSQQMGIRKRIDINSNQQISKGHYAVTKYNKYKRHRPALDMFLSRHFKLHYWPPVTCAWFVLTFIISYTISVSNGHVVAFLPFISDTGGEPPESCIMGQMMNIGALMVGVAIYIRYRQVEFILDSNSVSGGRRWNIRGLWFGVICSLGISVVGNFQWRTMLGVHMIGALMAFGGGYVFFLIQTKISFMLKHVYEKNPHYGIGTSILYYRVMIVIGYTIALIATMIGTPITMSNFKGTDSTWWTPDREGYTIHLIATFAEWLVLIFFILYTLTGTNEFKLLEFEEVRFRSKLSSVNKAKEDSQISGAS